jgi:hypothetical protein
MRAITTFQLRIAYAAIIVGVVLGAAGIVRTGSLFIAVGTGVIAVAATGKRRFERYLPLAIAVALFLLALALPKGL